MVSCLALHSFDVADGQKTQRVAKNTVIPHTKRETFVSSFLDDHTWRGRGLGEKVSTTPEDTGNEGPSVAVTFKIERSIDEGATIKQGGKIPRNQCLE